MADRFSIAFRADADQTVGGGHVMRSLALAGELRCRGHDVAFFCKLGTSRTAPALARSGFDCVDVDPDIMHLTEMLQRNAGRRFDALVIDSYTIPFSVESEVRHSGIVSKILCFDDLPIRRHSCDLLVDSVLGREQADYATLVPGHCAFLLGPAYVPLRSEFPRLRDSALERRRRRDSSLSRERPRVLISFGLTDPSDLTVETVAAILSISKGIAADVVIGRDSKALAALQALALRFEHLKIHIDPPSMAGLMASADIAVGAGGSTSWERCCLGLPTILFVLADNQADIVSRLNSAGAAAIAPQDGDPAASAGLVDELLKDQDRLAEMSRCSAALCDGGGAKRIAEHLESLLRNRHVGRFGEGAAI